MSKILLLGAAPLPYENGIRLDAHGKRTWQFAKPLVAAGHEVTAVCLTDVGSYPAGAAPTGVRQENGMVLHALPLEAFQQIETLQKIHDDFAPDAVVTAASFLPSYYAAQLDTDAPLWIDQNGDLMAEAQMLAVANDDNAALTLYATNLAPILARGDVFSAQSARQRYALIGQLAAHGRLVKETVGYEFVHVLPDAHDGEPAHTRNVIRGVLCGAKDFVILWSGGFNTWTDVETLFAALERAMAADASIHFVSTGGGLPDFAEDAYKKFQTLTADSKYADRFHLMGWVPQSDVANYVLEADLGINIDRACYETELGSRTRLLGWWAAGLATLTTNGCELTDGAMEAEAVATFPQGDVAALAEQIAMLAADPEHRKRLAEHARRWVRDQFSFAATTGPLLAWAAQPTSAPDRGVSRAVGGLGVAVLKEMERKVSHYREKLARMQDSRTWRLAAKLHRITRRFGFK